MICQREFALMLEDTTREVDAQADLAIRGSLIEALEARESLIRSPTKIGDSNEQGSSAHGESKEQKLMT